MDSKEILENFRSGHCTNADATIEAIQQWLGQRNSNPSNPLRHMKRLTYLLEYLNINCAGSMRVCLIGCDLMEDILFRIQAYAVTLDLPQLIKNVAISYYASMKGNLSDSDLCSLEDNSLSILGLTSEGLLSDEELSKQEDVTSLNPSLHTFFSKLFELTLKFVTVLNDNCKPKEGYVRLVAILSNSELSIRLRILTLYPLALCLKRMSSYRVNYLSQVLHLILNKIFSTTGDILEDTVFSEFLTHTDVFPVLDGFLSILKSMHPFTQEDDTMRIAAASVAAFLCRLAIYYVPTLPLYNSQDESIKNFLTHSPSTYYSPLQNNSSQVNTSGEKEVLPENHTLAAAPMSRFHWLAASFAYAHAAKTGTGTTILSPIPHVSNTSAHASEATRSLSDYVCLSIDDFLVRCAHYYLTFYEMAEFSFEKMTVVDPLFTGAGILDMTPFGKACMGYLLLCSTSRASTQFPTVVSELVKANSLMRCIHVFVSWSLHNIYTPSNDSQSGSAPPACVAQFILQKCYHMFMDAIVYIHSLHSHSPALFQTQYTFRWSPPTVYTLLLESFEVYVGPPSQPPVDSSFLTLYRQCILTLCNLYPWEIECNILFLMLAQLSRRKQTLGLFQTRAMSLLLRQLKQMWLNFSINLFRTKVPASTDVLLYGRLFLRAMYYGLLPYTHSHATEEAEVWGTGEKAESGENVNAPKEPSTFLYPLTSNGKTLQDPTDLLTLSLNWLLQLLKGDYFHPLHTFLFSTTRSADLWESLSRLSRRVEKETARLDTAPLKDLRKKDASRLALVTFLLAEINDWLEYRRAELRRSDSSFDVTSQGFISC